MLYLRLVTLSFLAVSWVLLSPVISLADEADRLNVNVGLKMWVAQWQAPLLQVTATGDPIQMTSSPTVLVGPTLTAALRLSDSEWFRTGYVSFNYLTSGSDAFDFNFSQSTAGGYRNVLSDRQDINFIVGMNVYRGFGVYMGYYGLRQDITFRRFAAADQLASRSFDAFVFGLSAAESIAEHLAFYGNVGMMAGSQTYKSRSSNFVAPTVNDSVTGWSSELGIKIRGNFTQKIGGELGLGMRAQAIFTPWRLSNGSTVTYNDITWGPTINASLTF